MMRRTLRHGTVLLGATGLLLVAGCASPPRELDEARTAYQQASQDPLVTQQAPVALYEAEQALNEAEREWEQDDNPAEAAHMARIAKTRVEIARVQAQREEARDRIDQLSEEREQVLLQASQQEVQAARTLAREGQQAAQRERERSEQLRQTVREQQIRDEYESELEQARQELADMQPRQTERGLVLTLGSDVLFAFDEAELKAGSQRNLMRLAEFLRNNPERNLLIEGYTDSVGTEAYNEDLSRRRADAVRDFLVRNGVSADRLNVEGYGESYPRVANDSPEARQMNRRVEVVVQSPDQGPPQATPAALPR